MRSAWSPPFGFANTPGLESDTEHGIEFNSLMEQELANQDRNSLYRTESSQPLPQMPVDNISNPGETINEPLNSSDRCAESPLESRKAEHEQFWETLSTNQEQHSSRLMSFLEALELARPHKLRKKSSTLSTRLRSNQPRLSGLRRPTSTMSFSALKPIQDAPILDLPDGIEQLGYGIGFTCKLPSANYSKAVGCTSFSRPGIHGLLRRLPTFRFGLRFGRNKIRTEASPNTQRGNEDVNSEYEVMQIIQGIYGSSSSLGEDLLRSSHLNQIPASLAGSPSSELIATPETTSFGNEVTIRVVSSPSGLDQMDTIRRDLGLVIPKDTPAVKPLRPARSQSHLFADNV